MPYGPGDVTFGGGQRGNRFSAQRNYMQPSYRDNSNQVQRPIVDPNNNPIRRIYDRRMITNTPVKPVRVNYPVYHPQLRPYWPPVNQNFYNPGFSQYWDNNYYGNFLNGPSIFPAWQNNSGLNFRDGSFWGNNGNRITLRYDASNNCFFDNYGNRYAANSFPVEIVMEGRNRAFYYNDGRGGRHKIHCDVFNDYPRNNGIYAGINFDYGRGSVTIAGGISQNPGNYYYGPGNRYGGYLSFWPYRL